jgi:hypothetical protein
MIKCALCKRITNKGESTGKFTTYVKVRHKCRNVIISEVFFVEGIHIDHENIVCMNGNGEVLLK